ncbi:hypothetical protein BH23CHL5_BH23CHL5_15310 [soil metagenome]
MSDNEFSQPRRSLPLVIAGVALALVVATLAIWLLTQDDDENDTPAAVGAIDHLDLSAPFPTGDGGLAYLHLRLEPLSAGENTIAISFTSSTDGATSVSLPVETIDISHRSLSLAGESTIIEGEPRENGSFVPDDSIQIDPGWTEFRVTIGLVEGDPRTVSFYAIVPDPNIHGFDSIPRVATDPDAESWFDLGITRWEQMKSLKYVERLSHGAGAVTLTQREVTEAIGASPSASRVLSREFEFITIGDQTWQRVTGGDWIERTFIDLFPPSQWPELYAGASDFALGNLVEYNGRETQIVTFYVAESETLVAAWYAWWVDTGTGYVVKEAMISQMHYMVYEFGEFDTPIILDAPIPAATPQSSPSPA